MDGSSLDKLDIVRKLGTEQFSLEGQNLGISLLDFWSWSSSDLVSNTLRSILAEFLVAHDLGISQTLRTEWDAYDLVTAEGITIEIKSAAYLQSWKQKNLSQIEFNIPQTWGWEASSNTYGTERKRQADVYVFAVLKHQNKPTIDPLKVEQWQFYVLPTAILDHKHPTQTKIRLSTLVALNPTEATFGQIKTAIAQLVSSGEIQVTPQQRTEIES